MLKSLREWQLKKLELFKCYFANGVWSLREYERAKHMVLNPPGWFVEQFSGGDLLG